jgi:hypothetical protein
VAQGLYPGAENIDVKRLYPAGDSLLHASFCCNSLASQVLDKGSKEVEIARHHTVNRSCDPLWHYSYSYHTPYRSNLVSGVYISLDLLRDTCMTNDSQQTPT